MRVHTEEECLVDIRCGAACLLLVSRADVDRSVADAVGYVAGMIYETANDRLEHIYSSRNGGRNE